MTTAVQVQHRRGTASQIAAFTGAQGELVVDTTTNRVVVQDGAGAGGWPAALVKRTAVSDANYTAQPTDRIVAYTALTASRIVTLPASSTFPPGERLLVVDETGNASGTVSITLTRAGSDKINEANTAIITTANGYLGVEGNGSNAWTVVDMPSSGVASINGLTGTPSITSNGGATVATSGSNIIFGEPGGFLNKFRNGAMDVAQRGTSGTVSASSTAYALDGWQITASGAGAAWSQQYNQNLAGNALRISCVSGLTACTLQQRIESCVAAQLLAANRATQQVTIQFTIYNNSGASITAKIATGYASAQDNFSTVTVDLAATNQQAIANGTSGTVAYSFTPSASLGNGYQVQLQFGGALNAASGYVDISLADIRATASVATGLNSNPPPPETRPVAIETKFDQRYYWRWTPAVANVPLNILAAFSATQAWGKLFDLPAVMRAAPTCNLSNAGHFSFSNPGGSARPITATDFTDSTAQTIATWNGWTASTATMTSNQAIMLFNNNAAAWIDASAEL
jgi:Major tropism determinant N-terminal domain